MQNKRYLRRDFQIYLIVCMLLCIGQGLYAHVPHDIIYSLDVSPEFHKDGLIFTSSTQFGEGHLVSHNYGETFSESHSGMSTRSLVTGHTFSPNFNNDGTVYMVTKKGYYKSVDRGENWVLQKPFYQEEVLDICLADDYANSKDLYVLTTTGVHWVRNDGASIKTLLKKEDIRLGKLLLGDGKLYVHTLYYEPQKKKKGMEHINYLEGDLDVLTLRSGELSVMNSRFESAIITDFDMTVTNQGYCFMVALKSGKIYLKTGTSAWHEILRRDADYIVKLRFSPDYVNDGTIAVGTAKGFVFMSEDQGQTWELRSNGLSRWVHHTDILTTKLEFSPNYKHDHTILLGKTTGFYKTTDRGGFWRHINVWNTKWGYYVLPAPGANSQDIFTATYNGGISRSSDHGDTWDSANVGITSAFANGMVLSPDYESDRTIFVLDISTGPYRSTDQGRSWQRIAEMNPNKIYHQPVLFRELGISPHFQEDGVLLFFVVPRRVLGVPEKMVYRYNDKTKEVKQVHVSKGNAYVHCFAFSPKGSQEKRMYAGSSAGVHMSTDGGHTWTTIFNKVGVQQVFISPNLDHDGQIYLLDAHGQIHRSTNKGESFVQADLNLKGQYVNNLTFSPDYAQDNTLYVTTFGSGVLKSTDNGKSWTYFGLKGKFLYTGISFSTNYTMDRTLFAPSMNGIYRSCDDGRTWQSVMDRTQLLPKVPLFTLKDPEGHEISIRNDMPRLMKQYDMYDEEAAQGIYHILPRAVQKMSDPRAYLATYYKLNFKPGYAVEVYFYGNSVEYQCVKGPDLGIADILVDGKKVGWVDLYAPQPTFDATGYVNRDLPMAAHTLRIEATGQKNPQSTGTAITYNAVTITNE